MISKIVISTLALIVLFCMITITWVVLASIFPVLGSEVLLEQIANISGIVMISIIGVGIGIYTAVVMSQIVLDTWRE